MPGMPFYISHKRVQALEIASVGSYHMTEHGLVRAITFKEEGFAVRNLRDIMFQRYVPQPGDFLVTYEDGYESFSPRKAFLEGYVREEAVEALPHRIDQALAQAPDNPRPYLDGDIQELLRDCRAEITRRRERMPEDALMQCLDDLAKAQIGRPSPGWLSGADWGIELSKVARAAIATINGLKADTVITRQMAGFKEVKNGKTDQA